MNPRQLVTALFVVVTSAALSGCAYLPMRAGVPLTAAAPTAVGASVTREVMNLDTFGTDIGNTAQARAFVAHRFDLGGFVLEPLVEVGALSFVEAEHTLPMVLVSTGTRLWWGADRRLALGAEIVGNGYVAPQLNNEGVPQWMGGTLELRGLASLSVAAPIALYTRPGLALGTLYLWAPTLDVPVGLAVDVGPVRVAAEVAVSHPLLPVYAPGVRGGLSAALMF